LLPIGVRGRSTSSSVEEHLGFWIDELMREKIAAARAHQEGLPGQGLLSDK
jgi:hypothetical protein